MCEELVHELQEECQKFDKTLASGIRDSITVAGLRVAYPVRKSTLKKLGEDIDELRENLLLALDALQLKDNERTQEGFAGVSQLCRLDQSPADHDNNP